MITRVQAIAVIAFALGVLYSSAVGAAFIYQMRHTPQKECR